jgi:predicted hotdog family 3-hydroxylacyl-ACP dehydratase
MPASSNWPNIADCLPHTGVARLLTRIISISPGEPAPPVRIEAVGTIPAAHPLVSVGRAPALLAIEFGAQAAALMEAIGRLEKSGIDAGPRLGSLVRVRDAQFAYVSLPVDTPIHVAAELVGSAPPLAIYRIQITLNGNVAAAAVISTHAGAIGGHS